jgi:SAM-dependent methyltransferase
MYMNKKTNDQIRQAVLENYKKAATGKQTECGCNSHSCCGKTDSTAANISMELGYSCQEVTSVPDGANLGLGCGNPQAIAALQPGETVLDLGSGAGFDCFLAAGQVGKKGRVIGVDMTPEMVSKARLNAEKGSFSNVDFRLGELENLPVADNSVDVIISNCVINLSLEKERVFAEAFRVLKSGGRLAISDIVATAELPADIKENLEFYTGCVSGASAIQQIESMLQAAGFTAIRIQPKAESKAFIKKWIPGSRVEDYIVSAAIEAVKP